MKSLYEWFGMPWYNANAADLQDRVIATDCELLAEAYAQDPDTYSPMRARQAAIHSRQDLVLVVSQLSSINRQLASIRGALWTICALLVPVLVVLGLPYLS